MMIFLVLLLILFNTLRLFLGNQGWEKTKVSINTEELVYKNKKDRENQQKLDINKIEYEDLIAAGFKKSQAEKIMKYRDFSGEVESIEEFSRVKGLGKASILKIQENIYIEEGEKKKIKHNINKLSEEELKLAGFTNKEIKKIFEILKSDTIKNNIELIEIVGTERYSELESSIKYND